MTSRGLNRAIYSPIILKKEKYSYLLLHCSSYKCILKMMPLLLSSYENVYAFTNPAKNWSGNKPTTVISSMIEMRYILYSSQSISYLISVRQLFHLSPSVIFLFEFFLSHVFFFLNSFYQCLLYFLNILSLGIILFEFFISLCIFKT